MTTKVYNINIKWLNINLYCPVSGGKCILPAGWKLVETEGKRVRSKNNKRTIQTEGGPL